MLSHSRIVLISTAIVFSTSLTAAVQPFSPSLLSNGKPTIVKFFKPTCPPCQRAGRDFLPLSENPAYKNSINWAELNVDANKSVAKSYNVSSVPAFVFFDGTGREVSRFTGHSASTFVQKMASEINRLFGIPA